MEAKSLPIGANNVPITVLGIWKTSVDKTDKMPCLRGIYISQWNSASWNLHSNFIELTF